MKAKPPISALGRRIMREQEEARQAAWKARADGTEHIRSVPRDKWVIRMLGRGALEASLVDAAERYAALVEVARAGVARSSSLAERVSGARGDPHAAMARVCDDIRDEAEAYSYVCARCGPEHVRIFDLAFAVPHKSLADIRRAIGRDSGAGYRLIVRALERTLEALVDWFDNVRPAERDERQTPEEFERAIRELVAGANAREARRRALVEAMGRPMGRVVLDPGQKAAVVENTTGAALLVVDDLERTVALLKDGERVRFERVKQAPGRFARLGHWRVAA